MACCEREENSKREINEKRAAEQRGLWLLRVCAVRKQGNKMRGKRAEKAKELLALLTTDPTTANLFKQAELLGGEIGASPRVTPIEGPGVVDYDDAVEGVTGEPRNSSLNPSFLQAWLELQRWISRKENEENGGRRCMRAVVENNMLLTLAAALTLKMR
ncbi:hypothetical protein LguiB_011933 [Lonicera macranthoides]